LVAFMSSEPDVGISPTAEEFKQPIEMIGCEGEYQFTIS